MKSACLGLMICAALVVATAASDIKDDRWFNGFYGPSVFFGPHSHVGQAAPAGRKHHRPENGHQRQRQYVNLEACECDQVIDNEPITEPTTAETETTASDGPTATIGGPTTTVRYETTGTGYGTWYNWYDTTAAAGKRSIDLDGSLPEDDERHVVDFQEDIHQQGGGHFEKNQTDGSSESSSEEGSGNALDHHHAGHQNIPEPGPFVAPAEYVPNSDNEFVHFRRQPGFRNPYTGECICSRGIRTPGN